MALTDEDWCPHNALLSGYSTDEVAPQRGHLSTTFKLACPGLGPLNTHHERHLEVWTGPWSLNWSSNIVLKGSQSMLPYYPWIGAQCWSKRGRLMTVGQCKSRHRLQEEALLLSSGLLRMR